MGYVVRDVALSGILIFGAAHIHLIPSPVLRGLAWTAYTIAQGMVWTGMWILAHECGHGALFTYRWLNSAVGLVLHSFLLMPFHSWRISHARHHKATGHMQRDMVFIPETKQEYLTRKFGKEFDLDSTLDDAQDEHGQIHLLEDTPLYSLYKVVGHQLIGMPGYLLFNISAPHTGYPWWALSHFYSGKGSPIFKPQDARDVVVSDLGIAAMLGAIYASVQLIGAWNTFIGYIVPYLMVNHWIGRSLRAIRDWDFCAMAWLTN
jgi:omega-6 fatty acid desaturase (delta-12 desaturase)